MSYAIQTSKTNEATQNTTNKTQNETNNDIVNSNLTPHSTLLKEPEKIKLKNSTISDQTKNASI